MTSPEVKQQTRFLRRLEQLASKVGSNRFLKEGIEEFLDYQEAIAKLQLDIQVAIVNYKKRSRADKKLIPHLEQLRRLRWHSRRLGDAVAWSVLLYNRQTIYALSLNSRVPISTVVDDDGSRGVLMMARSLTSREWGLPIVHDITDVLRIGDITFASPVRNPKDAVFRTIEVKTRWMGIVEEEDGSSTLSLSVQISSTEPFPDTPPHILEATGQNGIEPGPPPEAKPRREDRRLRKQLDRMDLAKSHRDTPFDTVTELDGQPHITMSIDTDQYSRWGDLRRAIRKARADGHSYFSIDGFVGYALFYNASGVTPEDTEQGNLPGDIGASLMDDGLESRNSITLVSIPAEEDDRHLPHLLPFFLYKIPQRAINDILRGRLVIMAVMNSARIEKLLTTEGYEVIPSTPPADTRLFTFRTKMTWPTGEALQLEAPAPWQDMQIAAHEFLSAASVIGKARALRELSAKIPYNEFTAPARAARDD